MKSLLTKQRAVLIASTLLAAAAPISVFGHGGHEDDGMLHMDENRRPEERVHLAIPDVDGYQVLKADLHMHTVFSDGLVWPTIRVQEAWQEGLDVIAITDHIEYQPHKQDIPSNFNRSYEIAKAFADQHGIILIRGSEITRYTPPGHFNAVFIQDASGFVPIREKGNLELDMEAIGRAADQGAFIFWNHPGWKHDSIEGSYEWSAFTQSLLDNDRIHGIEVFNGFGFHRKALDWALEHDLAVMGTSDIHNLVEHDYDMDQGVYRTMNLVFVKEKTPEAIREALDAGRCVAWATKLLAGKEQWICGLYDASVTLKPVHATDRKNRSYAAISNHSSLYFDLERIDDQATGWPERIELNPNTSRVITVKDLDQGPRTATYKVTNAYIGGYENLVVELSL